MVRPRWLPLVLLVPVLYGLGWLMASALIPLGIPNSSVSLIGTLLSFSLFLVVMPLWVQRRWQRKQCWIALGILPSRNQAWKVPVVALWRGRAKALRREPSTLGYGMEGFPRQSSIVFVASDVEPRGASRRGTMKN